LYLKNISTKKQLCSSRDVCQAIMEQQLESNKIRKEKGMEAIETIVLEHRYSKGSELSNFRVVENISAYYNFFNTKKFEFRSVVYSSLRESIKVNFNDRKETIKEAISGNKPEFPNENIFLNVEDNVEVIIRKKEIADKLLRRFDLNLNLCKPTTSKVNINILTESCKNICASCNQKCLYTLEEIKSKNIKMIKAELKAHSHPTSRMINGLARNKEQSIKELCFHYKNNHNQN